MADVTINLLPFKAVPVGTDLVPIWDSAGNITAHVTVASLQGSSITGANNQVVYRNSLGAYVTSAKLQFNGQTLTVEGQATSTHKGFIYRDGTSVERFSVNDFGRVFQQPNATLNNASTAILWGLYPATTSGNIVSFMEFLQNGTLSINDHNYSNGSLNANQVFRPFFRTYQLRGDRNNNSSTGILHVEITTNSGNNATSTAVRFNGAASDIYNVVSARINNSTVQATGITNVSVYKTEDAYTNPGISDISNRVKSAYNAVLSQTWSNAGSGIHASVGFFSEVSGGEQNYALLAQTPQNIALMNAFAELTGTRVFALTNGITPTASITDGFIQYSADIVTGNAASHFRTENGDVVRLYSIGGWGAPTGTQTRTAFDTTTVTLQQLAERVAALILDLRNGHQLLKA